MVPSNNMKIPEVKSEKTRWRPSPIPTNKAAELAMRKVSLIPNECIMIAIAITQMK
jgi:hypothetical protein